MQHTGLLRSAAAIPWFFLFTSEAAMAAESFDDIKSVASALSQPCSTSNGSRYCADFFSKPNRRTSQLACTPVSATRASWG